MLVTVYRVTYCTMPKQSDSRWHATENEARAEIASYVDRITKKGKLRLDPYSYITLTKLYGRAADLLNGELQNVVATALTVEPVNDPVDSVR